MRLAPAITTLSAWLTGLFSIAYLLEPESFDPTFRPKYQAHLALVLLHGLSSVVALGTGPMLLWKDPLGRGWGEPTGTVHRALGRLYVGAVLVGGLSGARLAGMAFGGLAAQTGFLVLAALWLTTAGLAFQLARTGRFAEHRRWMARNYALTFSAVTLRGMLHLGQLAGLSFAQVYPWAAWLCWLSNLGLAEAAAKIGQRNR